MGPAWVLYESCTGPAWGLYGSCMGATQGSKCLSQVLYQSWGTSMLAYMHNANNDDGAMPWCMRFSLQSVRRNTNDQSLLNDVTLIDCQNCRISRPYRDAQDRLLWRDKTCPAVPSSS